MGKKSHNPEKRLWRGRSYKNGKIIKHMREAIAKLFDLLGY